MGAPRLFLFTSVVQASLAIYALTRLRARPAPSTASKAEFDLAATAPVGGPIIPEPPLGTSSGGRDAAA